MHRAFLPQTIANPADTIAARPTRSDTNVAILSLSGRETLGLQRHGIHEVTGSVPVWSTR